MTTPVRVAVDTPAYSRLGSLLSWGSESPLAPGTLLRVPFGRREVLGIAWDADDASAPPPAEQLRPVGQVLVGLPPLGAAWRQLVAFTAGYYQRSVGEVALSALPPTLREMSAQQVERRVRRLVSDPVGSEAADAARAEPGASAPDNLSAQQEQALRDLETSDKPCLLFGATGSGKTEVYLQAVQRLLQRDPAAQALVMVPEINLTPQLEARFHQRFGASRVVSLHSGLTPPQRLRHWMQAHLGQARVVLGTRMAVFASMPTLRLIVVDEEHDPSYKQQEGARYSARDLAIWRARNEGARVLLGTATPALESWQACETGRYQRLDMPERIGAGELPALRLVDMGQQPRRALLAPPLLQAIEQRLARGEQALLLLNRRGYAPVLACGSCGWKSDCPHCSAYRVFHKVDRTLRCHHCGLTDRVPRACPKCGDPDLEMIGRGTEKLQEQARELLQGLTRPDGTPVRVARIDADSTRAKGALEQELARVHAGEVDVLVGTQMVAKGHDFRRITLVAALSPDAALFSSDYRAAERLFSLLMQAAGRAGRDAGYVRAQDSRAELWVQTFHPGHPLFTALRAHDYPAFARWQLQERQQAGLPPFGFQALLRADARSQQVAQAWLLAAAARADACEAHELVTLYPAVPLQVQRVANVERAQMLVESTSRPALQRFLAAWQAELSALDGKGLIRWAVDVDPLAI